MHSVSSFGAILNPDQVQAPQANSNEAYRRPCSILSSHWVALKQQLQVGNLPVMLLTSIAPSAVLVVGNGTNTYLSELLFPSVAKAVLKLKRVPIAIVGADSVRHCGAGERAGEVEPWEGGCVLQVGSPVKVIGAGDTNPFKQEMHAHMHAHGRCGRLKHAPLRRWGAHGRG